MSRENIYGSSEEGLALDIANKALSAKGKPDVHGPVEDSRAVAKANVKQPGDEVKVISNKSDNRFTKSN